jgi:parallel beta helix pectate lyase-like protein
VLLCVVGLSTVCAAPAQAMTRSSPRGQSASEVAAQTTHDRDSRVHCHRGRSGARPGQESLRSQGVALPNALRTVTVPRRIDATGRVDVTQQLQAFLNAVPDKCVVKFPHGGRYRVEDTLTLVDKHKVVLKGNGAKLFETTRGSRGRSLLSVVGGSDITVLGFQLRGADRRGGADGPYVANLEAQHGIELFGPKRVLIKGNTITNVWGDFVYLTRDQRRSLPSWGTPSRDVTILHNSMARNGRQGISFINVSRVLVVRNRITDVRRTVFDFEPNTWAELAKNVIVARNTVGIHRLNFLSAGGGGSVNNVTVKRNTLVGSTLISNIKNPPGETRRNFRFVANVSDRGLGSKLGAAVLAQGVEGIKVRDNVQPMSRRALKDPPMAALSLLASCGGRASGNRMGKYGGAQMIGDNPWCKVPEPSFRIALPWPFRATGAA